MSRPSLQTSRVAAGSPVDRLHAMDLLRALAMLLGIFLHAAVAYKVQGGWVEAEARRWIGMDVLICLVHGFRMPLFFVIAGFFGHMVYQRYGLRRFVQKRALRIGLPWALGMLVMPPLFLLLRTYAEHYSWPEAWRALGGIQLSEFTRSYHLWFLQYLMGYYVAALLLARLAGRCVSGELSDRFERIFVWLVHRPSVVGVLVLPSLVGMAFLHNWGGLAHWLPPGIPGEFVYQGVFFAFGWVLYLYHPRPDCFAKHWQWQAAGAVVTGTVLAVLTFGLEPQGAVLKGIRVLAQVAYAWCVTFGLMGLFQRYANRPSPLVRYQADAAYWMYLAHLPIVVYVQVLLAPMDWSLTAKFATVTVVTLAAVYLTYHCFVRYTIIGVVLHGPRKRDETAPLRWSRWLRPVSETAGRPS